VHDFLHAAIDRERRLEEHRAGRIGLEGAHRDFAAL
jgi:hypothetical protein